MGRRLRVVRAWMSPLNDASAHLIFVINGGVALAAAVTAVVASSLAVGWGIAIGVATFVGLTLCLLSRRTATIAVVAGAGLCGLIGAGIGAALVAGGSGFVAGLSGVSFFALAFSGYRRFVRATTGGGELEGRFTGTFNERDEQRRKGSGAATVVVSATDEGDHDLRVTGLVVGGVAVDFFGTRREGETIADLRTGAAPAARFELLRGKISGHRSSLIVDLEGTPFGSYVFSGQRARD